jgi:DNA polymerase III epsilon subunit family exonuclease
MNFSKEQPVSETLFTAFDFETTGLFPASDRIVEFGAVRFKNGEILDSFEMLVNPGVPIGADAAKVSGITDSDVADAPPVIEAVPRFLDFIEGSVLVAHNASFDVGFLRAAVEIAKLGTIENPVCDTQGLAIKAFPGKRSYSLSNLAADLGLPAYRAHRALDDAQMCMRLFLKCADELSFMGELELGEVLSAQQ